MTKTNQIFPIHQLQVPISRKYDVSKYSTNLIYFSRQQKKKKQKKKRKEKQNNSLRITLSSHRSHINAQRDYCKKGNERRERQEEGIVD